MKYLWVIMTVMLLGLSGCGTENAGPATMSTSAPMEAKFSPADGIIPFPNNLLFQNSVTGLVDGTLQVPGDTDPVLSMNTLDGFSTIAPITTTFSLSIDSATVAAGVRLYEVVDAGIANLHTAGGFTAALTFGVDYVALPSPSDDKTLVIKPLKPLKSNANYMVVVTNKLKSTSGEAAAPSMVFRLLKSATPLVDATGSLVPGVDVATATQLEGLRQLTAPLLAIAAGTGDASDSVAIAWTFKTQTINKVLAKVQADSALDPYATNPANFVTVAAAPSAGTGGLGVLDFYTFASAQALAGNTALLDAYTASSASFDTIGSVAIGAVNLPYYLEDTSVNPLGPITGSFQVDSYGTPTVKSVQIAPFIMTIPNTAGPWPVVIFQHGITVDKSVVFGVANSLAKAGFATIAMDSVMHGDRTFGVDYVTQDIAGNVIANVPDGTVDSSGTHFVNLTSLLTSRDNMRQSIADLIYLTRLLEVQTMDVVNNGTGAPGADGTADLVVNAPTVPVSFVGHSLGAMMGGMLADLEPAISTFVLANPGGEISTLLNESQTFGPIVDAGLASNGVTVGSADYNAFFVAAQTAIDDGDPSNYAAVAGKNILMLKVLDDAVVPNSQTDALALGYGLPQVAAVPAVASWPVVQDGNVLTTGGAGFKGSGFTVFIQGTHSSFLTPDPVNVIGFDVITEMQSETANYLGSALLGGATVVIGATPLPSTNPASSVVQ